MLAPRWRKVLRDFWNNKTRSILVVFSIAIGVAAIGMVASTYIIITTELPANYSEVNPAHATILTTPFDDELLYVLRNIEYVREVEGRRLETFRLSSGSDSWRDLELFVFSDFNDIQINKVWHESGKWPPGESEIIIERASLVLTGAEVGEEILIQAPNGQQRNLKIVGLAHDLNAPAGTFTNLPRAYMNFDTFKEFGLEENYNLLQVTVIGDSLNQEYVRGIINDVESKVEKSGRTIYGTIIPDPGRHWFESFLTPMAAILGVLGIIILMLSSLLMINIISAMLAQQVRQIGMMKAIGARTYQIFILYETSILITGILALIVAVPLSILGTRISIGIIAGIINFNMGNNNIPISILILQMVLSILIPVVAALIPILSGVRVTVHEAINDYGLNKFNFGEGTIDRILSYVRGLPRPLLLSLRNTFRRKTRVALTLLALTLSSAIFIAVLSVYAGLIATLDEALNYYEFDIVAAFSRPYRIEQISAEVDRVPGIVNAETWGITSTRLRNVDGSETNTIIMLAPPTNTDLINPAILEGRWLLPDDENALVINTDVLKEKPEIKIGDEVTLNIDGSLKSWLVVGIVRSVMSGPLVYTNYPYFSRVMGRYGLASAVYLATEKHDPAYQENMAKILERHFENVGINVSSISTTAELRETAITQFNVIISFLLLMAILLTIVGGFGLTGTMSLNVLERTREIGVMRAIGASNGDIMRIVIVEGVLIGVISWFLGSILSFPLGIILSDLVGSGFLQASLRYTFSYMGMFLWLIVAIILAIIASSIPARSAVRLPVHDVLAYE